MAILCGPKPNVKPNWRSVKRIESLSKGYQVCRFAEKFITVPDGTMQGQPLRLDTFQIRFILAVVDNPHQTRTAVLSMARRNGKSFLVAVIALAYLVGPLSEENTVIASAAHSRDQAALIFRFLEMIILKSEPLQMVSRIIPSSKRIIGLSRRTEYYSLSADAKTGFGRSLKVVILDESGQFIGDSHPYIDMLRTSQGSYEDAVFLTISTQAPSDGDWLSITIDDAHRSQDPHTVVHLYAAEKGCDLMDRDQWRKANPGLGRFRSELDLKTQLDRAKRLPNQAAGARNLLLNQRVAAQSLWISPDVWMKTRDAPDLELFKSSSRVAVGIDLSARTDLTAAVFAVQDSSGVVHLLPFAFTPLEGLEARSARDRAPYAQWVEQGVLVAVPGSSVDYPWVCEFLRLKCDELEIRPTHVVYDRWRIDIFKRAAMEAGFASEASWVPVGQGFKDMSPRLESFEALLLAGTLHHGGHPVLNLGAGGAIVVSDPARNRKLEKSKSTSRIDVLVASVMAAYEVSEGVDGNTFDVSAIIG